MPCWLVLVFLFMGTPKSVTEVWHFSLCQMHYIPAE